MNFQTLRSIKVGDTLYYKIRGSYSVWSGRILSDLTRDPYFLPGYYVFPLDGAAREGEREWVPVECILSFEPKLPEKDRSLGGLDFS